VIGFINTRLRISLRGIEKSRPRNETRSHFDLCENEEHVLEIRCGSIRQGGPPPGDFRAGG
jgi:hypothetical protein